MIAHKNCFIIAKEAIVIIITKMPETKVNNIYFQNRRGYTNDKGTGIQRAYP